MIYYSPHKWGFNMEENKYSEYYDETNGLIIEKISELRKSGKFEEVYNILKYLYTIHSDNDFLLSQLVLATIDFKPYDSKEILSITNEAKTKTTKTLTINYGYTIYYLSINDPQKAFEHYKKIKHVPFYRKRVEFMMRNYNSRVIFRKLVFDVADAITKINKADDINDEFTLLPVQYALLTSDVAQHFYDNKFYDKAIFYNLKSLNARDEKHKPHIYYKLAKCYYEMSDFNKCREYFLFSLTSGKKCNDKEYPKYLHEFILFLITYKAFDEALIYIKDLASGTSKDKLLAKFCLGKLYIGTKDYEKAERIFTQFLKPAHDNEKKNSFEHEEAERNRKKALLELVRVYVGAEDDAKGTQCLNTLYKDFPDTSPVVKFKYLYDMKRCNDCIDFCNLYIGTKYENQAKYYIGKSLSRLGRYSDAKEYLEDVEEYITNTGILFELGLIYDNLNLYSLAEQYYTSYVEASVKRNDSAMINKGLNKLVDFECGLYNFEKAEYYIQFFANLNPEDSEELNYLKAIYYYRKQDYLNAIIYFEKLYNTEQGESAKNYVSIIYRYINEKEKAGEIIKELENGGFHNEAILNRSKEYKDIHTKESFEIALKYLYTIKDSAVDSMAASEIIQILFKLDRLDEVGIEIENAYQKYLISPQMYLKYKQYLYIKKGEKYKINTDEIRSTFIDLAYDYRETRAVSCITCLNKANQGTKYLYLNSFELEDLYYELRNNLSKYNYFMTEFYDVYIIDMGKPIGKFHGIETNYIAVKCEQNTNNIHVIEPTLRKLNMTKKEGYTRTRTED